MRTLPFAIVLFGSALTAPGIFAAPPGELRLEVDCDAGDDLGRVLERAARHGGADIRVRGTCVGNFTIASDGVTLRGVSPEESILVAPGVPPYLPVVEVKSAERAALRNLTIRGGYIGAMVRGWGAELLVYGCRVEENLAGLLARHGGSLRVIDSDVAGGQVGIEAQFDGDANVQNSNLHGNEVGLSAFQESGVTLLDSRVVDNDGTGVVASGRSEIGITNSELADNRDVHVLLWQRSDASVVSTRIGTDSDTTGYATVVNDQSTFRSFSSPEIWGDVSARDASFLGLGHLELHGSIRLSVFSRSELFDARIDGPVLCYDASDTVCLGSVFATVNGCGSAGECIAPTATSAPAAPTDRETPQLPAHAPFPVRHPGSPDD